MAIATHRQIVPDVWHPNPEAEVRQHIHISQGHQEDAEERRLWRELRVWLEKSRARYRSVRPDRRVPQIVYTALMG